MRTSKPKRLLGIVVAGAILLAVGCKKEEVVDNSNYLVNQENLYSSSADKDKRKTNEQWVSILYANLFQEALSANDVFRISQCIESIGDKRLAREVIISNFMNKPDVIMPTVQEMQADVDGFINESYRRFLVRNPTEAELTWYRNYINNDPNVTPELVYFAFALSDEYLYY